MNFKPFVHAVAAIPKASEVLKAILRTGSEMKEGASLQFAVTLFDYYVIYSRGMVPNKVRSNNNIKGLQKHCLTLHN